MPNKGLLKPKEYDWKDSNMELVGSDEDRQLKKEAAMTEEAWNGAGEKVGLQIWRINKFKVERWPKEDYGRFYNGDSYIILNTYHPDPNSEALAWDVHFWIGSGSTQDEYGTAAYKTVELDALLNDAAVQHREVESLESDLFASYFKNGITLMDGGAETGFRHVTPEEYKPRLLHFSGVRKNITIQQVPLSPTCLRGDDTFILDNGEMIYQWNGATCNKDERIKAMQYIQDLKNERGTAQSEVLDQYRTPKSHEFYQLLSEEIDPSMMRGDDETDDGASANQLFRISDESGQLSLDKVKEGRLSMKDLSSDDVWLVDNGLQVFVYVGNKASRKEKTNGIFRAHNYLGKTSHPYVPITVVKEGQNCPDLITAMAG